jgi:hypothetical protein
LAIFNLLFMGIAPVAAGRAAMLRRHGQARDLKRKTTIGNILWLLRTVLVEIQGSKSAVQHG